MKLDAIQSALRERNIDAWLFYDHHHRDPIAYRVLGLPSGLMVTRRWFYLVPAEGEPVKLVHKIEAGHLDSLPGKKYQYSGWQELFEQLKTVLAKHRDLAMQYSPNNSVFTISLVDGGTIDLLRGLGRTWSARPIWWRSSNRPGVKSRSSRILRHATPSIRSWPSHSKKLAGESATAAPRNMRFSSGSWKRLPVRTSKRTILR